MSTPKVPASQSNFSSVKLPAALVQQAKEAAGPLRRSTAGQIEYWATLGRVVEHSGLSAQESRSAIENYETAARHARLAKPAKSAQVDDLVDKFMAVEADGSLANQVRAVVLDNRSRRSKKAA
jgi:ParD-like antitoxin of type II bacterial toxin-antitoxin system